MDATATLAVSTTLPLDKLDDLTAAVQRTEGFAPLLDALRKGDAATVDGAWNSSSALVCAALAAHAPQTLLVVLAHPGDVDAWCDDLHGFSGLRPAVFPAWDGWPPGERPVDEVAGQRLRLLRQLEAGEPPRIVVATMQALLQPVPGRAELARNRRRIRVGETLDLDGFSTWLVEHGYERMEAVELPGEFSRRGGILDVYSPDAEAPYRIELFGDEVESIRQFAPENQRSLADESAVWISGQGSGVRSQGSGVRGQESGVSEPAPVRGHLADYLPPGTWVALIEPPDLTEQGKHFLERVADVIGLFSVEGALAQVLRFPSIRVGALPSPSIEATCHLKVESVERFSGDVTRVRDELDSAAFGDVLVLACHNEGERKRLGEILAGSKLAEQDRLRLVVGRVRAGFRLVLSSPLSPGGRGESWASRC